MNAASPEELAEFEIDDEGEYIYWPSHDVHVGWDQFEQSIHPEASITAKQSSQEFNRQYGQAIQILRDEKFDVALLDLKMEDMDGIEVLKIFKKMSPDLQVIILTGHGSEIVAREGMESGAMDYLIKPCDFDELIHKIQEAVSRRR